MISLGQMNRTLVRERTNDGWLLQVGEDENAIFLAAADAPDSLELEQPLHAFVYRDSQGELVATTARPKIMVGQLALLKAKQETPYGTFFDWGLSKDILVPRREQGEPMVPGEKYLLYAYIDDDGRIAASAKCRKYLDQDRHSYQDGDEVHLTIMAETPMGFNVAVDYKFSGLLYTDQIFRSVKTGDQLKGYIRRVREDGLLDVSTQKPGYGKVPELGEHILDVLKKREGTLPLSDKSSPEQIKKQFNCSKKAFKQAIGGLRKQELIEIFPDHIQLK